MNELFVYKQLMWLISVILHHNDFNNVLMLYLCFTYVCLFFFIDTFKHFYAQTWNND